MNSFSNILTLADARASDLTSIKKSIILAKKNNSHVTVLSTKRKTPIYQKWLNKTEDNFVDHNGDIKKLVSLAKGEGVAINYKIREEKDQFTALTKQLKTNNYDLVIAEYHKEVSKLWSFESAEYTNLLKASDTSILFVGNHQWQNNGSVLAAIETEESTLNHLMFNDEIIGKSNDLANLLMSNIHLFNCYLKSCSISFSETLPSPEFTQHLEHLTNLAKAYHFDDKNLHIEEGLADDVIPAQAQKLNANVVVIGCGEHTGLLSKIKGHTLDYVLDNLNCDLLALKQSKLH